MHAFISISVVSLIFIYTHAVQNGMQNPSYLVTAYIGVHSSIHLTCLGLVIKFISMDDDPHCGHMDVHRGLDARKDGLKK